MRSLVPLYAFSVSFLLFFTAIARRKRHDGQCQCYARCYQIHPHFDNVISVSNEIHREISDRECFYDWGKKEDEWKKEKSKYLLRYSNIDNEVCFHQIRNKMAFQPMTPSPRFASSFHLLQKKPRFKCQISRGAVRKMRVRKQTNRFPIFRVTLFRCENILMISGM